MGLFLLDIDSDTIIVPYRLDVKNPLTKDLQKKFQRGDYRTFDREIQDRNILYVVSSIRELEKHIVFTTNNGLMMMNKNTLEIHRTRRIVDENLGIRLMRYYAHNGDDNRIMFLVTSDEWFSRKPTAEYIPDYLKTQIEMVKVDKNTESNPILVFYKEK